MHLDAYLERISYTGPLRPDLQTLYGIHRAHLLAITYENLDIHLGRPLLLDEARFFARLVGARRGGWCYEMNGLLAWALRQIGFSVLLLSATVGRHRQPTVVEGNHLLLLVELDQPYIADTGFGNGFLDPLPLIAGSYQQCGLTFQLATDGERWFFENHEYGGPGFDMLLTPCQLSDFALPCHILQTAPTSGFVRTTVCHRMTTNGMISLRGAILSEIYDGVLSQCTLASAAEYVEVLDQRFDLRFPEAAQLWETVWQKHQQWQASQVGA